MSRKRKVKSTTIMSRTPLASVSSLQVNWKAISLMLGGTETMPFSEVRATRLTEPSAPITLYIGMSPSAVVAMIPQRMPPRTPFITKAPVTITPRIPSRAVPLKEPSGSLKARVTKVGPCPTMPAFWKPRKAMIRPMPAPTAYFSDSGRASTIHLRTLVSVRMTNTIPSRNTAVSANCQLWPIAMQTV